MVDNDMLQKLRDKHLDILSDINEYDETEDLNKKLRIVNDLHKQRCDEEKIALEWKEKDIQEAEVRVKELIARKDIEIKEKEYLLKEATAKSEKRRGWTQIGVTIGTTVVSTGCFLLTLDWERAGALSSKALDYVKRFFRRV